MNSLSNLDFDIIFSLPKNSFSKLSTLESVLSTGSLYFFTQQHVNTLDFSNQVISYENAILIRNLLCNINSMIELNLSNCNLTTDAIILISHGLLYNSTLLHLNLSGNELNDESGNFLAFSLSYNTSIIKLTLSADENTEAKKWFHYLSLRVIENVYNGLIIKNCFFNRQNLTVTGFSNSGKTSLISNFVNVDIEEDCLDLIRNPSIYFQEDVNNKVFNYNVNISKDLKEPWSWNREYNILKLIRNKNEFLNRIVSTKRFSASSAKNSKIELIVFPQKKVRALRPRSKTRRTKVRVKRQFSKSSRSTARSSTSRVKSRRRVTTRHVEFDAIPEVHKKLLQSDSSNDVVTEKQFNSNGCERLSSGPKKTGLMPFEEREKEREVLKKEGKCSLMCDKGVAWSKEIIVGPDFFKEKGKQKMTSSALHRLGRGTKSKIVASLLCFKGDTLNINLRELSVMGEISSLISHYFYPKQGVLVFVFKITLKLRDFERIKEHLLPMLSSCKEKKVEIFLVCSHVDEIQDKRKLERMLNVADKAIRMLFKQFMQKISFNALIGKYLYPVSNETLHGVEQLKRQLTKTLQQNQRNLKTIPIHWCKAFLTISYRHNTKEKLPFVLSSKLTKLYLKKFNFTSKEDFNSFIAFFTDLGFFHGTFQEQSMNKTKLFVVLNEQFLLNLYTTVLLPNKSLDDYCLLEKTLKRNVLIKDLKEFKRDGKLSIDLAYYLLKDKLVTIDFIDYFVKLLDSQLLLTRLQSDDENYTLSHCMRKLTNPLKYYVKYMKEQQRTFYEFEVEFQHLNLSTKIFYFLVQALLNAQKRKKKPKEQMRKEVLRMSKMRFNSMSAVVESHKKKRRSMFAEHEEVSPKAMKPRNVQHEKRRLRKTIMKRKRNSRKFVLTEEPNLEPPSTDNFSFVTKNAQEHVFYSNLVHLWPNTKKEILLLIDKNGMKATLKVIIRSKSVARKYFQIIRNALHFLEVNQPCLTLNYKVLVQISKTDLFSTDDHSFGTFMNYNNAKKWYNTVMKRKSEHEDNMGKLIEQFGNIYRSKSKNSRKAEVSSTASTATDEESLHLQNSADFGEMVKEQIMLIEVWMPDNKHIAAIEAGLPRLLRL